MMNKTDFKIESLANQTEVIQFLDDMIYEFNSASINKHDGALFTKVIRDHDNIIAAVSGWTWAGVSEITLLWVNELYRGLGLGKMLLAAAEDEIAERGCSTILLRSYSFQAPGFYKKNGYKTVYMLNDFPKGFTHYTLVKRIP